MKEIREQIDKIDEQMMDLFQQRMGLAKRVGENKKHDKKPILDEVREEEILKKRAQGAFSRRFMQEVLEISRCVQTKVCLDRSIVLIGMMGSGTSTIGRILADMLGMEFVDTDIEIENEMDKTVGEIFEKLGEKTFRVIEEAVLEKAASGVPKVISTGGGVILSEKNREIIKMSFVVFLDRPIDSIKASVSGEGRPLFGDLEKIASERQALYEAAASLVVVGNLHPKDAANRILNRLQVKRGAE